MSMALSDKEQTPKARFPAADARAGSTPLRLAFIDPGLRKAPFFLDLRKWLAPHVQCLYWSQRPVVRSYMRSARVAIHPRDRSAQTDNFEISDSELRRAIGDKELTLRPTKALLKARSLLASLSDFLDVEQVDAILVWNGSNLRGALAIHLARQRHLPVIHAEHGYLAGTTQIDLEGVNYCASISRLARNGEALLPPEPALDAALDADIARFKAGEKMRDLYPLPSAELRRNLLARAVSRVSFWLERRALPRVNRLSVPNAGVNALPERYVLLPFQVRSDSQLVLHSPLYGDDLEAVVRELDAALAHIDPQLRLVVKFHPYELPLVQFGYRHLPKRYPRVCFVSDVPMTQLLDRSSAVVTVNSTTGFEAVLYDKPVLTLGRNFYTVPGIVECLERREDLEPAVRRMLEGTPDPQQRRAFLRFVRARFHVAGGYHDFSERSLRAFASRITELLAANSPDTLVPTARARDDTRPLSAQNPR
jgi:capsular polysaccharide export protein